MKRLLARLRLPALLLLALLPACTSQVDKRTLQYLNTQGFGNRYTGNAEEQNYVTLGDTVVIRVEAEPGTEEYTGKVAIDGTILLPEVGAVHVAGMTRTDIETLMTEKLSPYFTVYDVTAQITSSQKEYFIFGEVQNEGAKTFPGDLTVWEAVMEATPFPDSSNLGRVKLIRADPVDPFIIYIDINDVIERGDSTYNVLISERDIIYVPPTLLAQLGYFLDALLFPVKQVISGLGSALLLLDGRYYGGGYGGRRGGNFNNNNTFF